MKALRIFTLIITAFAIILMNACSKEGAGDGEQDAPSDGDYLQITFDFEKQSGWASNQFAVWIEDANGGYVTTLYATKFTANGGYKDRPEALSEWTEKSGLANMEKSDIAAVSGATPKAGSLTFYWDFKNAGGENVEAGEYYFFIEGSLRWSNRVMSWGVFEAGGVHETEEIEVITEYVYIHDSNHEALTEASGENNMIKNVSASYIIVN